VVMKKGKVEQRGPLRDLVHSPATQYVAHLIDRARTGLEALLA